MLDCMHHKEYVMLECRKEILKLFMFIFWFLKSFAISLGFMHNLLLKKSM